MAKTANAVNGNGAVDWARAASTGAMLVRGGPAVSREEAVAAVEELRVATRTAEGHVRDITGLGHDLPLLTGDIVDRPGWVHAAAAGLGSLTEGTIHRQVGGPVGSVMATSAGVQTGMVLAFLAARILGQYDPFAAEGQGKLMVVAPNVEAAHRAMGVDASDFRLWVCLHESTHRLQFTAVPWLRDYFADQVRDLLSNVESMVGDLSTRLPGILAEVRRKQADGEGVGGPVGMLELMQAPEQRETLRRLLALSTLLEGHADHVMDAVGPDVVPSVASIRKKFTERRKGGGLLDRFLRMVLGVNAKVRQYAEGAAFTDAVVARVGMDGFNAVWTSPETLPSKAEIADPDAWLARVHG